MTDEPWSPRESNLDPAALAVVLARLAAVAEEMLAVLRRSAFSPNIKERADCSTALFTPTGELLAQSESIPVHLGSMPASVAAAIAIVGDPGRASQIVLNDPYAGGTHLNDLTVVAPVHLDGALVGWAANRAHHADIGGAAPGSIPADATHIAEEGIRLPPVLLTPEVRAVFLAASRTPHERAGDLDAQVGANRLGSERFAALAAQATPFDEVLGYGERRMRAALAALPDGTWRFTDQVDSTGAGPGQREPATIAVAVTIDGDEVTFDFTGTAPQSLGNVNAVEAVTISAVGFALRSATDPTIPANGGAMRPVRVVAPTGTLVAAEFPAAVGAGNVEVSQRIADVCLGALAQVAPDRVGAASQGTMNNLLIGGAGWVYYETVAGGQGGRPASSFSSVTSTPRDGPALENARPGQSGIHTGVTNTGQVDAPSRPPMPGMSAVHTGMTNTGQVDAPSRPPMPGMSAVHTGMTNTKNTPTEALERAYPLRVLRYRIREGSGGAGLARGGDGIERDLQVLEDCTASLITERRVSRPWGLAGGEPGAAGENWLLPGGDEARAERLPDKCTVHMTAGDVVRMLTPGGGGWGAAVEQPRSTVPTVAEVALVPMDDSAIPGWLERSRRAFVAELVEAGIDPEIAEAKARATEADSFPDGRPADGHRVFALVEAGQPVGHLWIALDPDATDAWWVYDVEVDEQARGRGLGRRLMELAEVEVARLGGTSIGLSVFGTNSRARRLYESLGYEPTSIRMRKRLE